MSENLVSEVGVSATAYIEKPNALRIDDKKVTDYLLNEDHPQGAPKAKFFKSVGFTNPHIDNFKAALRNHAETNPIADSISHSYGTKFVIECEVKMPNGQKYCIRTVWNDHNDGQAPKLITAHPLD